MPKLNFDLLMAIIIDVEYDQLVAIPDRPHWRDILGELVRLGGLRLSPGTDFDAVVQRVEVIWDNAVEARRKAMH